MTKTERDKLLEVLEKRTAWHEENIEKYHFDAEYEEGVIVGLEEAMSTINSFYESKENADEKHM